MVAANNKFKEKQQFNDVVVTFLVVAGVLGSLYGAIMATFGAEVSYPRALGCLAMAISLSVFLWSLKQLSLKVSVNENRIKYKLKPFHSSSRKIKWEDVASCEIVKSPNIAAWHGANISYGESFFSLAGRNGLSIVTKDGQRLFIGCGNLEELSEVFEGKEFGSLAELEQLQDKSLA